MSTALLTVDQIAKDTLTQISLRYWSKSEGNSQLEAYDSNLIDEIYLNEIIKTKFSLKRIMLLEFSQYLENYLWVNYKPKLSSDAHILSIVIMINEKFRERVSAWDCFLNIDNNDKFSSFFQECLKLIISENSKLSYQEETILIKFLDNCVNSLELDLIRTQVQKICGLPMWISISQNRRDHEFKKFPKLRKFWKAIEKNDLKLSETEKELVKFERTFLKNLILKFLKNLNSFDVNQKETGAFKDDSLKFKMHYLERCLELFIDFEALLPTRRFFNTLLEDSNLLVQSFLSSLLKNGYEKIDTRLFNQLLKNLKFYATFEIDDHTGEAKTESECQESHYKKLKLLQRGVFKYFREDLFAFSLTNIATIDKRDILIKHLNRLSQERLYALAEYLYLVPGKCEETQLGTLDKEILLELIICHMERKSSQLDYLNQMPLFPTEEVIWDENLVPNDFQQQSTNESCLALPKLGLQFLTLQDYLLRNFNLFRLEAAYELRQDIEDACIRMRPYYSYEDQQVKFSSWSRMAQPITSFQIIEICKSNVGENAPSKVRADVTIDLEYLKQDIRQEWNSLRKHDIGFLISLKPSNTPEQRYNSKESFLNQMGNVTVRGCEIEGFLNEDGKLIIDEGPNGIKNKLKFENNLRTFRVFLDSNQYKSDTDRQNDIINNNDDIYSSFNVFLRRRPKESNFKSVLESIRDLMNNNFVVPDWLRDIILGYGDPAAANYKNMMQSTKKLDFNDTFLSFEHLKQSFPQYEIKVAQNGVPIESPFKLTFQDSETNSSKTPILFVEPYTKLNLGPYSNNCPKINTIKFTPTQVESIKSGMQAGLTIVVGPPGTGKTDVAVQIISNIYHNFPEQKTLIVTHSNQALNQLFEKIIALDIDERHLLRLGHGEESLETEKDFSRYGRVNFVLAKRLELLDEVEKLKNSLEDVRCDSAAYSCESASHFYVNFIQPRCEIYIDNIKKNKDLDLVEKLFPFTNFFNNAPQPLFKKISFEQDLEIAKGCFRYITNIFKQLDEFRAFELIRNGADRAEYLLVKEAKIIAMTCTHAALKRRDLVKCNFKYDNILMEESAQILEIETFIPLLLQNPDHNGHNRLKRWIMIGDHHQLPPVIKNMTFQKYSNMEQSLFTRFVKLGVPTVELDAQGRCRSSLCDLFKWRYKNLGSLEHVNNQIDFKLANTGFVYDYQLINVDDFNGQGESEPQPHFYQNLAEAEYSIALFMFMRLIGYPNEKITILTTYNGQKHLIRDVLKRRCGSHPLIGQPKKITTVDKYQGQQNDYIILSLVKTKNIGHLRDVRRLIVAMSRARLGLYILARVNLFKSCYELTPVFNILIKRPTKLHVVLDEQHPTKRMIDQPVENPKIIENMQEMAKYVYDFYQSKLQNWKRIKNTEKEEENKMKYKEKMELLDEEEKFLREKLDLTIEQNLIRVKERLDIKNYNSSSSSSEEEDLEQESTINN